MFIISTHTVGLTEIRRGMGAITCVVILEIISKINMNMCHNKLMMCEVLSTF